MHEWKSFRSLSFSPTPMHKSYLRKKHKHKERTEYSDPLPASEGDHSFLRNCQVITAVILKNKTEAQTFLLRIHTIQASLESTIISS